MGTDQPPIEGFQTLRQVAAKALDDDEYRQRLVDDPGTVLQEEGLTIPNEVEVVVVQNTDERIYLVLPTALNEASQLDANEVDVTVLCETMGF